MNGDIVTPPAAAPVAPHWFVYFTVADLDDAAATIAREGGEALQAPVPIPDGRILVARDPQGAHFALFEGEVDP